MVVVELHQWFLSALYGIKVHGHTHVHVVQGCRVDIKGKVLDQREIVHIAQIKKDAGRGTAHRL